MAPVFVGSNNEDSRIRSNRIGFAASTANPGSADEGDGYYNSSDNQLKLYDGSAWSAIAGGGGSVELTLSGTLSNGQTVIVQSDGTVTGVATTGAVQSEGSNAVYHSASTSYVQSTFDSAHNRVVIVFRDEGNSNYGTAVVGEVDPSNNSISFGSEVVFESASVEYVYAGFDSTNERVVIAYRDGGNSNYGTAIVGEVDPSNNSISFGTATVFESFATIVYDVVFDSNSSKIVPIFRGTSNHGYGIVGTVDPSNNSISFGTAAKWEDSTTSGNQYNAAATFATGIHNKVVVAFQSLRTNSNGYGQVVVGSVDGTNIYFGQKNDFERNSTQNIGMVYDSNIDRIIIAYANYGDNSKGEGVVGTITGMELNFDNVNAGVEFESGQTDQSHIVFDPKSNKVIISYRDDGDTGKGKYVVGIATASDNSISFTTPAVYETGNMTWVSSVLDSKNNKVVTAYRDSSNSNYGTAVVIQPQYNGTNATSGNFIGFSDAAYTNGQTAKIQIVSSVDDAQSGLTTGALHYVQNDGSLGVAASTPSIVAGTALSGTEISIKN